MGDVSDRARDVLTSCDAIVCEDTRITGKLLELLELPKKELISFHGYSDKGKLTHIFGRLESEHLALVSDAGTPGISDPGYAIVSEAQKRGVRIEAIPGPSAFLTALSVSGLPINQFVYFGFLPLKKGRKALLESLKDEKRTVVFYESPHRIGKTLSALTELLSDQGDRDVVICRELTKMHEEVIRTSVRGLKDVASRMTVKGEFCVVLGSSTK